jgi:hypothetical protein
MEITNEAHPHAGEKFHFSVSGGIGITRIEVHVDSTRIFEKDCADPPCHEMVQIPSGTKGAVLRIVVKDSAGKTSVMELTVAESQSGASGAMSAGA